MAEGASGAGGGLSRLTFGGLATGLDTRALVEQLLTIEREPLNRLNDRRDEIDRQRSALRELNTKLLALRDAARDIDNRSLTGGSASFDEELLSYKVESSDEDVVTALATTGATNSQLDVAVTQLATRAREITFGYGESDLVLTAGQSLTVTLDDADASTFTVTAGTGGLTLSQLREQINASEDNRDDEGDGLVRAEVIRDGADQFRLVLSSVDTGVSNGFAVTGDLQAAIDPIFRQAAQNARVRLFEGATAGVEIESESNTIENAISGVTLELHRVSEVASDEDGSIAAGGGLSGDELYAPETLDIQVDTEAVQEDLQSFVDAFNEVMKFFNKQFEVDESTKRAGPLSSDGSVRALQQQMQRMISQAFVFPDGTGNRYAPDGVGGSIGAIGIELRSNGTLKIDEDKLSEALSLAPSAVRQLISGVQDGTEFANGIATTFVSDLDPLLRVGDGLMTRRDQGFQDRLDVIDDSIQRFEARMLKREDTLLARFAALEALVASSQSQQGFLNTLA